MADKVTEIKVEAAPTGYEKTDYQFFRNATTNQLWKASVVVQPAYSPMINGDVEAAPTQLAIQVAVSPVSDDGKALREDDKPIIIDVHSHTFTSVEMSEPDFDPVNRVMSIIVERIHTGEARLEGATKIRKLGDIWTNKAKLKMTGSFKYIEPEPAVAVDDTVDIAANGPPVTANAPLIGFSDGHTTTAPAPQDAQNEAGS